MSIEIDSSDVIRLISQFLKENNLINSLKTLQEESGICTNTVECKDEFCKNIYEGKWDIVLQTIKNFVISTNTLINLYEQIIFELVELREISTARCILRQTEVMNKLRETFPERYVKLEEIISKTYFDSQEIYKDGVNKEKRREKLSKLLCKEIKIVESSRLLKLLGQSLKWQQSQGLLPPGISYDLFCAKSSIQQCVDEEETFPIQLINTIKFTQNAFPNVITFSPDGQYLVSGTNDGFIEVWNYTTAKLRMDLTYQKNDQFMLMQNSITALQFNHDSELIASGSSDGKIKIWRILTGLCCYRFDNAHSQSINCILFTSDNFKIITCSNDNLIKLHSLRNGTVLKEYNGHTSFVKSIVLFDNDHRILSSSSDGSIKIWSLKNAECLNTIKVNLGGNTQQFQTPINNAYQSILHTDTFIICNRSQNIFLINKHGKIIKSYNLTSNNIITDFILSTLSPKGNWLYTIGENNYIYCLNLNSGKFEHTFKAHDKTVLDIIHHPQQNILVTCSVDGTINIWK